MTTTAAAVSVQTFWRCKFRFLTTPKVIRAYVTLKESSNALE